MNDKICKYNLSFLLGFSTPSSKILHILIKCWGLSMPPFILSLIWLRICRCLASSICTCCRSFKHFTMTLVFFVTVHSASQSNARNKYSKNLLNFSVWINFSNSRWIYNFILIIRRTRIIIIESKTLTVSVLVSWTISWRASMLPALASWKTVARNAIVVYTVFKKIATVLKLLLFSFLWLTIQISLSG